MNNTKKKIACLALASALVIPGVMGLAGCKKGHTHAFNSDPFYEVVTEGETKIARSWRECTCGAEDAHKMVYNAVIVSANSQDENYVQKVLDTNINNKTIVFDEGTYTEPMYLRPTLSTLTAVYKNGVVYNGELSDTYTEYKYQRDYNNITFAGTSGAIIKNYIRLLGGEVGTYNMLEAVYDPIRDITVSTPETEVFNAISNFTNITVTRMNFVDKYGRISFWNNYTQTLPFEFKNININNCTFDSDAVDDRFNINSEASAIFIRTMNAGALSNVTVRDNSIKGHYQGISVWGSKNLYVLNNTVSNTSHNALALQSSTTIKPNKVTIASEGEYIVKGNTISNTTDRAIRFGECKNISITIENNTFNNCYEDRTDEKGTIVNEVQMNQGIQLVATGNLSADENKTSSFTFKNNTVDGEKYEDMISVTSTNSPTISAIIYIEEPTVYVEEE